MGCSDARSAQIGGPDFILQRLQVIAYSGEPFTSKRACNLFSKDHCRAALGDESKKRWPQMTFVDFRLPFPRVRERLTGAAPRPDASLSRPSGEFKGVLPAPDPAEEMASSKPGKGCCIDLSDVSFIDRCFRKQVAEPLCGEGVVLVEVHRHSLRVGPRAGTGG
jgi:hypothetical protein